MGSPITLNTADDDGKRKPSELRNPSDGEIPVSKRSRHEDDSDEDLRKRNSRRGRDRYEDSRTRRKHELSSSPERKSRGENGSRRYTHSYKRRDSSPTRIHSRRERTPHERNPRDDVGSDGQSPVENRRKGRQEGDGVFSKEEDNTSLPEPKLRDADVDKGSREPRAHTDERALGGERVSFKERDHSPVSARIHREDDRSREHRKADRSISPSVRSRNGADRNRHDVDRDIERKRRAPSGDYERRDNGLHGNHEGSKSSARVKDAYVFDRDRDGSNFSRRDREKGKLDERVDVLDRYVGDGDAGVYDRHDTHRQRQERASTSEKNRRNDEEDDLADDYKKRSRSRAHEDEPDYQRNSRRSHKIDRHNKHKSPVEEDRAAARKNKNNSRSKLSPRDENRHTRNEKEEDPKGVTPANGANAEQPAGRSGGVYIPPFKLAQMMKEIQDKSGVEYQRMTWDALRKSINGLVNKVNASNIKNIIPELLSENLIRGRGLFARSCMKSQMASPLFTHVFAALVAVVNTKFPELGELLLKRVILQFRRALKRNDKPLLLAAARFIAHLVNQQVAHEVVALEVLMVLLENPTDDSVEVSVGFVKECGAILQDVAPRGLDGIFERLRGILHEGEIDKRVQFMIEGLFAIRKAGFQGHPAVIPELDLVEQEDQFTHEVSIAEDLDAEMSLDIFKADPNFVENEKKYEGIKKDILGEDSSDDDDDEKGSGASSEDDDDDDEEDEAEYQRMQIKDETETNLVNLRRTIYLTIMSSVDFEEAGHKLLKIKLEPGQEMELNIMLLECCSQERTYLRYYGLLGQRFCMINRIYQQNFDECFVKQYSMIHRLETNKLRNVAKFFAHLLGTDALPWDVLAYIKLTEEDTTSSSRIFIKILFQELSEHLGLRKLNEKLNDPDMARWFEGIFPKDNPKNTRFAINFFTSIGLGGITDSLREHLKNMPRLIMQQQRQVASDDSNDSGDDSDSSEESGSSSGSESSSSESESGSSSSSESESASESDSDSGSRKRRKRR